jgi:ankyrin repeat protein
LVGLVETGANPNLLVTHPLDPDEGQIPLLTYACILGLDKLAECITNHGVRPTYAMLKEIPPCPAHKEVIGVLRGFINTPDPETGMTMLLGACFDGYPWGVDLLIGYNADVKSKTHHGDTCLTLALSNQKTPAARQAAVVQKLVAKGVHVDEAVDERTPLARACSLNNRDAVLHLLNGGASTDLRLKSTMKLLDLVCSDAVNFDTFCLVMKKRPELLPHAKLCFKNRIGDLVDQKREWADWAATRPKSEVNSYTV